MNDMENKLQMIIGLDGIDKIFDKERYREEMIEYMEKEEVEDVKKIYKEMIMKAGGS